MLENKGAKHDRDTVQKQRFLNFGTIQALRNWKTFPLFGGGIVFLRQFTLRFLRLPVVDD